MPRQRSSENWLRSDQAEGGCFSQGNFDISAAVPHLHRKRPVIRCSKIPCDCRYFRRPFRAIVARDRTQAKAWAMLSWPVGPKTRLYHIQVSRNVQTPGPEGPRKLSPGFSQGKHKKTFGPEGAGVTRWFTEVNVTAALASKLRQRFDLSDDL
jgi:hypothetical protein